MKAAREKLGLTQPGLGRLMHPPRPQRWVSAVETAEHGIRQGDLTELSRVLNVSADWLLNGDPQGSESAVEILSSAPIGIPVLDQEAHAGATGSPILDYVYWAPARVAGRHIQGIKVRGDCMRPEVIPGDVVFIDRERSAKPGSIVVVSVDDELHVCRAQSDRKGALVFINTDGVFDAQTAKVEGVVIQIARDVT